MSFTLGLFQMRLKGAEIRTISFISYFRCLSMTHIRGSVGGLLQRYDTTSFPFLIGMSLSRNESHSYRFVNIVVGFIVSEIKGCEVEEGVSITAPTLNMWVFRVSLFNVIYFLHTAFTFSP